MICDFCSKGSWESKDKRIYKVGYSEGSEKNISIDHIIFVSREF